MPFHTVDLKPPAAPKPPAIPAPSRDQAATECDELDRPGPGHKVATQSEAEEAAGSKLAYPFELKGYGTFDRQVTGQRTFYFNSVGLAHIVLY